MKEEDQLNLLAGEMIERREERKFSGLESRRFRPFASRNGISE